LLLEQSEQLAECWWVEARGDAYDASVGEEQFEWLRWCRRGVGHEVDGDEGW
jgi:hypothetical protein